MASRTCPHCSRRVPVTYEGSAIAADADLVTVYAEHGCAGDWMPVDDVAPAPEAPASPAVRQPRGERKRLVYAELGRGPGTCADIARRMGAGYEPTRRALARLRADGRVERVDGVYRLVPTRDRVLRLLHEQPRTERQLREVLGLSTGAIHYHLTRLEESGRILRGPTVPAYWRPCV